jgi:PAS domain S-box-containing protein
MAMNRDTQTILPASNQRRHEHFAAAWAWLTDPHPSITNVNERTKARIFSAVHLPMPFLLLMFYVARSYGYSTFASPASAVTFATCGTLLISYALSRTRHYKWGVYGVVIAVVALIVSSIAVDSSAEALRVMPVYFAHAVIIASLFLSVRTTVVLALGTFGLLVALGFILPETSQNIVVTHMRAISTLYLLVIISTVLRSYHERKIVQDSDKLREGEALYRTLFEETIEPISIHDKGIIVAVNPAMEQLSGFTESELKGRSVMDFVHPDSHALILSRVPAGEQGHEVFLQDRAGNAVPTYIFTKPIRYQGKEMRMVSVRDLRLQRMAESARLENAIQNDRQKVLQRLIRNLSHDFRTPLTVIKTSLYMLQHSTHDVSRHQKHLDVVQLQTSRLQEMMDDFIALARLDYVRKADLIVASADVNQIIESVIDTQQALAKKRGVTLTYSGTGSRETRYIDKDAVQRIAKSLISNGLFYTSSGGRVDVSARADAEALYLSVEDTGTGISAGEMSRLFEPFYRVDPTRSTETGGAGLGLTIAKKLLDVLGGDIKIESEVGRGSCFRVRIPFSEPEPDDEEDFDLLTEISA